MNAIAYARVSSRAQTFDMQRSAIERAAAARGDVIVEWRSEKMSGRTLARPEMDRLRADTRAGLIRKLYVYRIDRLARPGIRDTFEVIEELRRCGVELVSVSDGFALDEPAAEVVLAVMAWAANMQRLVINERIADARERVEGEDRAWGRPRRLGRTGRPDPRAARRGALCARRRDRPETAEVDRRTGRRGVPDVAV
jgi:DNA invertase Pin-like site-specific DNA recombinase